MSDLPERVARIEEQNEHCAEERKDLRDFMTSTQKTQNQILGGIRVLVVLWALVTSAAGLTAGKILLKGTGYQATHSAP